MSRFSSGVCQITVNMAAGANRHGTVSAVHATERDTPAPPATLVRVHLSQRLMLFCHLAPLPPPLSYYAVSPATVTTLSRATDELLMCSGSRKTGACPSALCVYGFNKEDKSTSPQSKKGTQI